MTPDYQSAQMVAEPRTQIASELDSLESAINSTECVANELAERIHTAVCPRTDDANKNPPVPEPVRSPLGTAIHEQKLHLERINEQLRRLLAAVDLPYARELGTPKLNIPAGSSTGTWNG